MIVIADTSPICYLILIGEVDLLPKLYRKVFIPNAVYQELKSPKSPMQVQQWIGQIPAWLEVTTNITPDDEQTKILDRGEQEAIALAEEMQANLIVMDEKLGRSIAKAKGFTLIGLLGVLYNAAQQDLIDLSKAFDDLQQTTFFVSPQLLKMLLEQNPRNK